MKTKSSNNEFLKKYRKIIISIFIFILLDAAVMGLNFLISFQIQKDAVGINLSGRQRMLSQKIAKDILQVNEAQVSKDTALLTSSLDDLKKSRDLFDQSLNGFDVGGQVMGADNKMVNLTPVESNLARESINKTKEIWQSERQKIDTLLSQSQVDNINPSILKDVTDYANANNLVILNNMNNLTVDLENVSSNSATRLRMIQIIGMLLALINFFIIMFYFLRQLRQADAQVEIARQQTKDILGTVNEGLFLIDKDLIISHEYSANLEKIIDKKNLSGINLIELLKGKVSDQDLENTKLYVEQLYNPWVVEDLIQDLNPLRKIRIITNDESKRKQTKFLDFNFLRVLDTQTEEVNKVFVSVVDITEAVNLQQNLERERVQHSQELELISNILSIDNQNLISFIETSKRRIDNMNDTLKVNSSNNQVNFQSKVNQLYRETHSLKGDASAINLSAFVILAEKLETQLKELSKQTTLTGNDFLPFTVNLKELLELNQFIESLAQRLRIVGQPAVTNDVSTTIHDNAHIMSLNSTTNTQMQPISHRWQTYFVNYAKDIATRQGKKLHLICEGFDNPAIAANSFDVYKDIAMQLLKNAIVHGIENPETRKALNKSEIGTVKLTLETLSNKTVGLSIFDDGQGINVDKLREKAIELNITDAEGVKNLSQEELYSLIFQTGLSTSEKQDEDAGRGIGMDIVKELIESKHGEIKIDSKINEFTTISILFPLN